MMSGSFISANTGHINSGHKVKDLNIWDNISDQIEFPDGIRHGTVFKVSKDVLDGLKGMGG